MFTPQEVAEKKFQQSFLGGYNMTAVDEFLEALTADYTALYKENAVLKSKMKVLVEKVEEYRSNEDSVRRAYLAVQSQAERELMVALEERENILVQTRTEAQLARARIKDDMVEAEKRLDVVRRQTAAFVNTLKECYAKQASQLDILLTVALEDSPKKKRDDAVAAAAQEINFSLSPVLTAIPEPAPVAVPAPAALSAPDDAAPPPPPAPDEPTKLLPAAPAPGVLTYSEVVGGEDIWKPEEITESHAPQFNFTSLGDNFGHAEGEGKQP
ncbi:MAG: DivIVA domain-containing protein [Oscillospiraceae bacterium]|jgi:cell division initiation protein|nr:DivIVA domain-containing protein [Oscillospiraceae bacterium]